MTDSLSAAATTSLASASGADAGRSSADKTALIDDYSAFLTLLTAQLQNQNPLEPMDTKEFTNQLTQFSGVEQSIQTNSLLEDMIKSQEAASASSLVGYLGNTITAEGNATRLEAGTASWRYDVQGAANNASIIVRNSAGAVVYKEDLETTQGTHGFTWDGRSDNGSQNPDGIYSLSVEATNADGGIVPVKTEISGRVDGIDLSGVTPTLAIGSATFPVTSVRSVGL
ncbi:MAG: flagellar hook capping FlgD N-terminal domain-containing protein [Pseudomonadota bacterium]